MLADVSLDTKKIDIIQWVSQIQDKNVIDDLQAYQHSYDNFSSKISQAEELALRKGIEDFENGNIRPHEDALAIYGKWLKND